MAFTFSVGYRSPISSFSMNRKIHEIWGRNGVLDGFIIEKHDDTHVKITGNGNVIIEGVKIGYSETNPGNPLRLQIPHTSAEKMYVYGMYNHKLGAFTLHCTDGKNNAQGDWKVFLGHVDVIGGAITGVQGIVDPKEVDFEAIYRRIPNLNELINFFYESTDAIGDQITIIMNDMLGDLDGLLTEDKTTIVNSINELFNTKEPTLTRKRILDLLGDGDGNGNINIGSINGIKIEDFAQKKDLHSHVNKKFLDKIRYDGGNDGPSGEVDLKDLITLDLNDVRRRSITNGFGADVKAGIYSDLAHYATDRTHTGAIRILLPKGYTGAMVAITIKGYNFATGGSSFELLISGKLDDGAKVWKNGSIDLLGHIPFKLARLGHTNAERCCILLGDEKTEWNASSLFVEQVIIGGKDNSSWRNGWSIEEVHGEADFIVTETPKIITGGPQEGEYVKPNLAVQTGPGLIGGGTLTSDRTISVDWGTGNSQVPRGNHVHDQYLTRGGHAPKAIYATDSNGSFANTGVNSDLIPHLNNLRGNIQEQIDSKAWMNHSHDYLSIHGGTVHGGVNMQGHEFRSDFMRINGHRLALGQYAPPQEWGAIWIQV